MQTNGRAVVAWVAASVLVVAGVIVLIVGLLAPVSFGWFAYQPLADAALVQAGSGTYVSSPTVVGSIVLTIGLLGLAFLAGWRAGIRRRS